MDWSVLRKSLEESKMNSGIVQAVRRTANDNPLDGDSGTRNELVELFLDDIPGQLMEIRTAIQLRSGTGLFVAAQSLKSSVAVFRDQAAFEAAVHLEQIGQNSRWDLAEEAWICVKREMLRLSNSLAELTAAAT